MPLPDQREQVFRSIREALRTPAPHRHAAHAHEASPKPDAAPPASEAFRAWLPAVGPGLEEQISLFAQNAAQLKAEFFQAATPDEASAQLKKIALESGWKRIATHPHPLASELALKLNLPTLVTDPGYAISDLEPCDAAITGCDALIAQTGSVLVTNKSAGGRALSVLPPHHVVIAKRSQMVPDLTAAYQLARQLYAPNWPSFLSFITGPSRTGDIERILVLGAHGPKRLTIFLIES
jgi:L-lactate dehydrogenase complex protein LldG